MLGHALLMLIATAYAQPLQRRIISLPFDQLPSILRPTPVDTRTFATLPRETETPTFPFAQVIKLGRPVIDPPPLPVIACPNISLPCWQSPSNLTSLIDLSTSFNITQWTTGENTTLLEPISSAAVNATQAVNVSSSTGLDFLARPLDLSNATLVAYSYSILLSEGFEWAAAGSLLPGLYGGSESCTDGLDCFAALPTVSPNGTLALNVTRSAWPRYSDTSITLTNGQWMRIRVEADLGGQARLYVDDRLAASVEEATTTTRYKTRTLPKRQWAEEGKWTGMRVSVPRNDRVQSVLLAGHRLEVLS